MYPFKYMGILFTYTGGKMNKFDKYNRSKKGKARAEKYRKSKKGKKARRRYACSKKGREAHARNIKKYRSIRRQHD